MCGSTKFGSRAEVVWIVVEHEVILDFSTVEGLTWCVVNQALLSVACSRRDSWSFF